jgi:HK97 gp10 family phage protein
MGVTVKIEGGDKYKKFLAKMAEIAGGVKAGILNNATTTDGKSIAEYAVYNEFGTSRIPARPFMRTVAKEKPKQWIGEMVRHVRARATDPAIWKQALGVAGESMKSDIKDSIQNGNWTPNAPATVRAKARKGKVEPDHPLIDTGQMLVAVSYEVVDK